MQASGKVIMFKTPGITPYHRTVVEEVPMDAIDKNEKSILMEKALKVLNGMEGKWETNHNDLELRDNFHLLRYYLKRLHHA